MVAAKLRDNLTIPNRPSQQFFRINTLLPENLPLEPKRIDKLVTVPISPPNSKPRDRKPCYTEASVLPTQCSVSGLFMSAIALHAGFNFDADHALYFHRKAEGIMSSTTPKFRGQRLI